MTRCVCGNTDQKPEGINVRMLVCRCKTPGPGRRARGLRMGVPDTVPKEQVEERRRVGLPEMPDSERAGFEGKWI